jgi:hypothetical protein
MIRSGRTSCEPITVNDARRAPRGLGQFLRNTRAAVSIVAALALPILLAFASLVAEYGHGMLIKTESQRVADLSAYAGALAYNSTASTSAMTSAADSVAALNGISSGSVSASLVASPTGDGNQAVMVKVSSNLKLYLAQVIGGGTTLPVSATSYAELGAGGAGCIIALNSGGAGVTLSGGTSVTASKCSVASNASLAVPCGTTITAQSVTYNTAAPTVGCNGIQGASGSSVTIAKKPVTDPLAGTSGVTAATSHLATVSSLTAAGAPSVSGGTAVTFGYTQATTQSQLTADGCSGAFASNTWTVSCPNGGTYTFGALSLSGGITVNFNTSGSASTTYKFSGLVNDSGTALNFGPGTFYMAQGLTTGGGSTTTFGAGIFYIGQMTSKCSGAKYSICHNGTLLSFGGPSTFVLQSGVYNSGGETLVMGAGTTNSFQIGPSSAGDAFTIGGGATTTLADALGGSSVFQLVGNFNISSGGGSCTTISAAAQHDIYGNLSTAGGTILGAGVYSVTGYVALGGNGGGDVTCGGQTVGMSAPGVTFVIGGSGTPSSGTCSGDAFCVAAGYGHVTLTAPSSGTTQGLVVVGPTLPSASGNALFTEGSSNTSLSGDFYFPQGSISMSGAATVGDGTSQCLELVGTQVTLSGGSALASSCVTSGSGGGSGTSNIMLVQ